MENNSIIKIVPERYFPVWAIAAGCMMFVAAFAAVMTHFYEYFLYFHNYTSITVGETLLDFAIYRLPLVVLLIGGGIVLVSTQRVFEVDLEKHLFRNGAHLYKWDWGEWEPIPLGNCSYISFQRYDESIEYTFGGLIQRDVKEHIYDLRFIYPNGRFRSFLTASDFKTVSQMILLGKRMSNTYGIPFRDYVKELILKEQQANMNL